MPAVADPEKIGTYDALCKAGGGYVWDEVLEYRVWCHPECGAPDEDEGSDYYYAFDNFDEALQFSQDTKGAEQPLALVLQREWINEPKPGVYERKSGERIAEWQCQWLAGSRRTPQVMESILSRKPV